MPTVLRVRAGETMTADVDKDGMIDASDASDILSTMPMFPREGRKLPKNISLKSDQILADLGCA